LRIGVTQMECQEVATESHGWKGCRTVECQTTKAGVANLKMG